MSEAGWRALDLFAPTPEHALFQRTLDEFVAREVEPQAAAHDRDEPSMDLSTMIRALEVVLPLLA